MFSSGFTKGGISVASQPLIKTIANKVAAYTILPSDNGAIINCTSGSFTVTLPLPSAAGSGFTVTVANNSANNASNLTTISSAGGENIDAAAYSLTLRNGTSITLACDGTNWQTISSGIPRGWFSCNTYGAGIYTSANASSIQALAIGPATLASGFYSTALGLNSNALGAKATGSGAMALGGSYASGTDSFAAGNGDNSGTYGAQGIGSVAVGFHALAAGTRAAVLSGANNTANGSSSVIAGGSGNTANSGAMFGFAVIGGGRLNTTSSDYSTVCGGYTNTATGYASTVLGGDTNTASAQYSMAGGGNSVAAIAGKSAYACGSFTAAAGTAQRADLLMRASATAASTNYVLTSDGAGAAATTNQVVLPASSSFTFDGIITARQQAAGGTNSMGWKVEGLARIEAAGNIVLVASTVPAIASATPPTGWTLTCTADTTNQAVAFTFNMGATTMNVRVVGNIRTAELTYA